MAVQARRSSVAVKIDVQLKEKSSVTGATDFSSFKTLDNVSDIPDLGGAPEQIDVTAVGDERRKFINGIIEQDELEFTCFYEEKTFDGLREGGLGLIRVAVYASNEAKEADDEGSVAGAEMVIWIKGNISVAIAGFGVGDALNYTMRVAVEELEIDPEEDLTLA